MTQTATSGTTVDMTVVVVALLSVGMASVSVAELNFSVLAALSVDVVVVIGGGVGDAVAIVGSQHEPTPHGALGGLQHQYCASRNWTQFWYGAHGGAIPVGQQRWRALKSPPQMLLQIGAYPLPHPPENGLELQTLVEARKQPA